MPAKAYSYIRFSTPEQALGDSLRRQLALSQRYAEEHGLDLDTSVTFRDEGLSAFKGRNIDEGQLGDFIGAVDTGLIPTGSFLLIESLDRLSRENPVDALPLFTSILNKGITIVTLTNGKEYTDASIRENPFDLLMSILEMSRAHEESAIKSKRLSAAWKAKREKAQAGDHKITGRCPAWLTLDKTTNKFEVIEDRVAVVQRIFKMTTEDGLGKSKIVTVFNGEGVPTFGKSEGWHKSYVQKILDNPAIVGTFQPMRYEVSEGKRRRVPDGGPIEGYFPAIVDKATFARAREVRSSKRIGGGRKGLTFSNLLAGIAKCGLCGSSMNFVNKGENNKYLVCSNAIRGAGSCRYVSWRYPSSEFYVLHGVEEVEYQELFPSLFASSQEALQRLTTERLIVVGDLEDTTERLSNTAMALSERQASKVLLDQLDSFEAQQASLTTRLEALDSAIVTEQDRVEGAERNVDETRKALHHWVEVQSSSDTEEIFSARSRLNQLLKRSIDRITFNPPTGDEERRVIEITFQGTTSYSRLIRVQDDQTAARGFKMLDGEETESDVLMESHQGSPEEAIEQEARGIIHMLKDGAESFAEGLVEDAAEKGYKKPHEWRLKVLEAVRRLLPEYGIGIDEE